MTRPVESPAQPGPAADDTQGVIHDIGYRHYTGPRLGRGYIRRSLFVESARGAYGLGRSGRSKVMPMLLAGVMCLPALVIVVVTIATGADSLVAGYATYVPNMEIVIAIYVAGQAPASVSRDLRFGVTSLYFSRPLERLDYVMAKFTAMATAVFVLIAAPLTIMFIGALVAKLPPTGQAPDYLRSLAGALVLALVLAGVALFVSALTPRRGLGVAAVISVLLVLTGVQHASRAIALEAGADTAAVHLGLLSPFGLVNGIQTALFGSESVLRASPTTVGEGLVFATVATAVVTACIGLLMMRYRKVSVS